jgi:hypothetical protein
VDLYTQLAGLLGRGISSVTRPLAIQDHTHTHTVGFKPTIPVFERGKKFHALDRAITVIGYKYSSRIKIYRIIYIQAYGRNMYSNWITEEYIKLQ